MPAVDFVVSSPVNRSVRARQVASMFDVPFPERSEVRWTGDVPIEARPWSVGLIVGPSGAGKSSIMRQMFGDMPDLKWSAASVVDDFTAPLQEVTDACSAVGFNTIPAWLRPYHVLSNGERFRVDLARRLVEIPGVIVVDGATAPRRAGPANPLHGRRQMVEGPELGQSAGFGGGVKHWWAPQSGK